MFGNPEFQFVHESRVSICDGMDVKIKVQNRKLITKGLFVKTLSDEFIFFCFSTDVFLFLLLLTLTSSFHSPMVDDQFFI